MATKSGTKIKRVIHKIAPGNAKARYDTLHELLILKLRVLHDVETQLIDALPKMAKAASSATLRTAFEDHLEETKIQEQRLNEALELMGDVEKHKMASEGIRGIIADAEWVIKQVKDPAARDAALTASAQYAEHYEIAGYGSAIAWAEEMRHTEVADLLHATLGEEKAADEKLTTLAEGGINEQVEAGM